MRVKLFLCLIIFYAPASCEWDFKIFSNDSDETKNESRNESANKSEEEIRNTQSIKRKEREKENIMIAKKTIKVGSDDSCHWRYYPIEFIRGEMCGAHYKVLGLDRKKLSDTEKTKIKKSYRTISLSVHPDKNSSPEAPEAFKLVTNAYKCLSDEHCKSRYDSELNKAEETLALERNLIRRNILEKVVQGANQVHYYVSVTCMYVFQTGRDLWELAGEFEIPLFGEPRPIGKAIMAIALALKGRWIMKIYALAYAVVRINYELAKQRGLM